MSTVKILVGDFVVVSERYRYEVLETTKVSEHCFWYRPDWGRGRTGNTTRRDNRNVIFAGPETIARKLLERLVSSEALKDDEIQKATDRCAKRDEELLACANSEKDQVPLSAA